MTSKTRPAMIAFGIAAVLATAATGLTAFRGETKEASVDVVCAAAAWPMIPARCLEGGRGHDVRAVTIDRIEETGAPAATGQVAMELRFETAFQ